MAAPPSASDLPSTPAAPLASMAGVDEAHWQRLWQKHGLHRPQGEGEPAYVLEMWPYPSGDLHMGHVRNYCIGDVFARFWRMQKKRVLHPMGWDALGLPAETQAIREGIPPQVRTPKNIARMRAQMQRLGLSYDWSREMASSEPSYYRWNQWFFLQMLRRGLAYRRQSRVHFCPGCQTVLANEQVHADGRCWRGHDGVRMQEVGEWAFRITAYAEELLAGLQTLPAWPSRVIEQQRHWLGRSEGAHVRFAVLGHPKIDALEVFTTRIDTLFGCTVLFLAPEDPRAAALCDQAHRADAERLIARVGAQDTATRQAAETACDGVPTGAWAVHPLTGAKLPIWLANFVVADYGTGVVMGVPAHDARDFAFAKKFGLPLQQALGGPEAPDGPCARWGEAFTGDGVLLGEHPFAGQTSAQARQTMAAYAKEHGFGGPTVRWHLRDWGFSRQRYWGTPIPIVHCPTHGAVPVPEDQLPVVLPDDAQAALAQGVGAPLSKIEAFVKTTCPTCGGPARREVETMDTFVDSSWYYARFLRPDAEHHAVDADLARAWLPVDLYVGGPEHAVLHLLYFRFFHRVMRDLGLVQSDEPVRRLLTQGMVNAPSFRCARHGYQRLESGRWQPGAQTPLCPQCDAPLTVAIEKMSKSKYNGVDPVALIDRYGADTARLYVLFAAPPEKDLEWSTAGVEGQQRFLARLRRMADVVGPQVREVPLEATPSLLPAALRPLRQQLHQTLHKVLLEYRERNHFNTAIASIMELLNAMYQQRWLEQAPASLGFAKEALLRMAQMLSPMAPHIAEHVWAAAGGQGLCAQSELPTVDQDALRSDRLVVAVQVGGKWRGQIEVENDATAQDIARAAQADEKIARHLQGQRIVKEIYVPGRLLNLVVRPA